jgi:hypothetical protein
MLSSIMVSFLGDFPFSLAEEDEGDAASIFFESDSVDEDLVIVSDVGADFWVIKLATDDF